MDRKSDGGRNFSYAVERASKPIHDVPAEVPGLDDRLPVKVEAYAYQQAIDSERKPFPSFEIRREEMVTRSGPVRLVRKTAVRKNRREHANIKHISILR